MFLQNQAIRMISKHDYYAHTLSKLQELNIMKFEQNLNHYHLGNFGM